MTGERIVVACSGDAVTLAAVRWLVERRAAEVIAVTLDVGQRELEQVREQARDAGAVRAHVLDARDEFAHDVVLRVLQAGAWSDEGVPFAAALEAPLIAKKVLEIAGLEQVSAIVHGGARRGRLGQSFAALGSSVQVSTFADISGLDGTGVLDYARARGFTVALVPGVVSAVRHNLWGRSIELSASAADAQGADDFCTLTRAPADTPDDAASVEIAFDRGIPMSVNGVAMPLTELIANLEIIAGVHGIGRIDTMSTDREGVRSRVIYEAPAAIMLHTAHGELERLALEPALRRLKRHLSLVYADVIENGRWFTPAREAIDAFVQATERYLTGRVRVAVSKGLCRATEVLVDADAGIPV